MTKLKEKTGPKFEYINGRRYEYPCYKKDHTHSIDCCTPEMWDAASEAAYAESSNV